MSNMKSISGSTTPPVVTLSWSADIGKRPRRVMGPTPPTGGLGSRNQARKPAAHPT